MRFAMTVGWVVLAVMLLPGTAGAQAPAGLEAALAPEVGRTRLVRLRAQGSMVTGRLMAAGNATARLESGAGTRDVSLAGVDAAWSRRHSAGKGALIGGLVGAVVGGVFGATSFTDGVSCDGTAECAASTRIGNALVGGLIVGGSAALVGAGVGALIPRWKRIFP